MSCLCRRFRRENKGSPGYQAVPSGEQVRDDLARSKAELAKVRAQRAQQRANPDDTQPLLLLEAPSLEQARAERIRAECKSVKI